MTAFKFQPVATLAGLIAACAIVASPLALASEPAKGAQHEHGASVPARLSLDHGKKWATDEPLRAGMTRIKALVEPRLGEAHAGKLDAAQYAALAGQVEAEVGAIVANCKLEPKADAMLHLLIADIGAGTDAMAGKAKGTRPEQGLVHVAAAVNQYGKYFQHPRFKSIHVDH